MLKVGLVGIGFMGRTHLNQYKQLEKEGYPLQLAGICDGDEKKFRGIFREGNMQVDDSFDVSMYKHYYDFDAMLADQQFDIIDISLPTYLHADLAIKAMESGAHVICEKPMALNSDDARRMLEASQRTGKKLMIAQVLRFWPEYEYLKETVNSGRYGSVLGASFFRGGNPPVWTFENWMVRAETSGGGMMDLHIHDVDMVNWLFGKPNSVSTIARAALPESDYDIISTNYMYDDSKVVNTQIDRALHGDFGFEMSYRVNFEKGSLQYVKGVLSDYPQGGTHFTPELPKESGFYREIKYFAEAVRTDSPIETSKPADSLLTLQIAEAERKSAMTSGALVAVGE